MVVSKDFDEFVGRDLGAVVFVRDYLQLEFDPPPRMNIYAPATVTCGHRSATFGETAFANLLVAQIGKVVRGVELRRNEALEVTFEDASRVSVSLLPDDAVGPEAVYLSLADGRWLVL
jgi:hypothetical protein